MSRISFEAIGTSWVVDVAKTLIPPEEEKVKNQILHSIDQLDIVYSRFRIDSTVNAISQRAGTYTFPSESIPLFAFYRTLYEATGGMMTPLVGDVLSNAGYDLHYTLVQKKQLTKPPSWDEVMQFTPPQLHTKKPVTLDFGAAGKGYIIDQVVTLLQKMKLHTGTVDAGHDIVHFGSSKSIRVGLEHPYDTTQVVGVATIQNQSICASAGNRRKWQSFHHIINPFTLTSPANIIATWAVAANGLVADGMSTALFLVDPAILLQQFAFEYVILYKDMSVKISPHFPGEVFVKT